jgi:hypothetical protein
VLRVTSTLLVGFWYAQGWAAPLPPLEQLEARLSLSPAMQVLDADYALAEQRLSLEQTKSSVSIYSNTSLSDVSNEAVDVNRTRSYQQFGVNTGLRIPVLGSRLQKQAGLDNFELEMLQRAAERELGRRQLLQKLRSAYADYWGGQSITALARKYSADAPELEHALALRTAAGLLLDSDRLEMMSGFALARRDELTGDRNRLTAFEQIKGLTGPDLTDGTAARPTRLGVCTPTVATLSRWIETHPQMQYLRRASEVITQTTRDTALYGVNSEVRIGYQSSTEFPAERSGGAAAVTWSFDVPLDFFKQRRLQATTVRTELSRARLAIDLERSELEQYGQQLLAQRGVLEESLQFASLRLTASDAAVRERELRAVKLAGDVVEQLQQARLARYQAAKSVVEAEVALAQWSAQWAVFEPTTCASRSLYLWSSQTPLTQLYAGQAEVLVSQWRAEGLGTLLISLDAEQLAAYREEPQALRQAIAAARARGLRVELLLGESSWILPQYRDDLVQIILSLRQQSFDGLHLDIEPNQLEHVGRSEENLLEEMLLTLRGAAKASPWPVDLSLHPRYLTRQVAGRSLGDHLTAAGISVTLMIYVANPERVVEIAKPLLERYPQLMQRVALSVEDILSAEESLYHYEPTERARRIEQIERELTHSNFAGITLQPTMGQVQGSLVVGR